MATNYQTLIKLNWENQAKLIDDLNRNFAIIENSPLYKGVPGEPGTKGDTGTSGVRGSRFFFVRIDDFIIKFPDQPYTNKNFTIDVFNSLIVQNETLNKVKEIFGLDPITPDGNFVEGDIVVLPDTLMIRYQSTTLQFVDTGVSFNILTSWEQTLFEKIQNEVADQLERDERLNSLQNVFKCYYAWAKWFSDDSSNVQPTNQVGLETVFYPDIPGVVKQEGILMKGGEEVRIVTFNLDEIGDSYQQETVIGDPRKYVSLLNSTLGYDGRGYSSFYAPGYQRLPSLLVLQNDGNTGIMVGNKNDNDYYRYSHIFHGINNISSIATDALLLKSHTSPSMLEYSELVIAAHAMAYEKYVHFGHDLRLDRNLRMPYFIDKKDVEADVTSRDSNAGLFDTGHIKTGRFTTNPLKTGSTSIHDYWTGDASLYRPFWNGTGDQVESATRTEVFDAIYGVTNDSMQSVNKGLMKVTYKDVMFTQYPKTQDIGLVLVVDEETGLIQKDYFIDATVLSKLGDTIIEQYDTSKLLEITNFSPYYSITDPTQRELAKNAFASSDNINILAAAINTNAHWFINYWRKDEWDKFVIPTLNLNTSLSVRQDVLLGDESDTYMQFFKNNRTSLTTNIGYEGNDSAGVSRATIHNVNTTTVNLPYYKTLVLVTDGNGKIIKTYKIETVDVPSTAYTVAGMQAQLNADATQMPYSSTNVVTSNYINWILILIDNLKQTLDDLYWRKDQYDTAEIPALTVSGALNSMGISEVANGANFDLIYGRKILTAAADPTNNATSIFIGATDTYVAGYTGLWFPNMARNGDSGYKIAGTIPTDNLQGIMVTNSAGKLINTYTIETEAITYDVDGLIDTFPDSSSHVATMNYVAALIDQIDKVIELIPEGVDAYTKEEFLNGTIENMVVKNITVDTETTLNNTTIQGDLTLTELGAIEEAYHIVGQKDEDKKLGTLSADLLDGTNDLKTFILPETAATPPEDYEMELTNWETSNYSIPTGNIYKWLIPLLNSMKAKYKDFEPRTNYITDRFTNVPNGAIVLWHSGKTRTTNFGKITNSDGIEYEGYYKFNTWDEFGDTITYNLPRGWYPCCGVKVPTNDNNGEFYTPDIIDRSGMPDHKYKLHAHGFDIGNKQSIQDYQVGAGGSAHLRVMVSLPIIKWYEPNGDVWTGIELDDDSEPPDEPVEESYEREWYLTITGNVPTDEEGTALTDAELKKINVRVWRGVKWKLSGSTYGESLIDWVHGAGAVEAYWYAASNTTDINHFGWNEKYPTEELFDNFANQMVGVKFVYNGTEKNINAKLSYYGDLNGVKSGQGSTVTSVTQNLTIKDGKVIIPADPFADVKDDKSSCLWDVLGISGSLPPRGAPQYWNLNIWKPKEGDSDIEVIAPDPSTTVFATVIHERVPEIFGFKFNLYIEYNANPEMSAAEDPIPDTKRVLIAKSHTQTATQAPGSTITQNILHSSIGKSTITKNVKPENCYYTGLVAEFILYHLSGSPKMDVQGDLSKGNFGSSPTTGGDIIQLANNESIINDQHSQFVYQLKDTKTLDKIYFASKTKDGINSTPAYIKVDWKNNKANLKITQSGNNSMYANDTNKNFIVLTNGTNNKLTVTMNLFVEYDDGGSLVLNQRNTVLEKSRTTGYINLNDTALTYDGAMTFNLTSTYVKYIGVHFLTSNAGETHVPSRTQEYNWNGEVLQSSESALIVFRSMDYVTGYKRWSTYKWGKQDGTALIRPGENKEFNFKINGNWLNLSFQPI
jgi:hypothetical protein